MGCDIHICVEVLVNEKWEFFGYASMNRSYAMFTRIAGVRKEVTDFRGENIEPISLPRGIPDDISPLTKGHVDDWDYDGHSHTWLSSDEFRELDKWRKARWPAEYHDGMLEGLWFFGDYLESWEPKAQVLSSGSPVKDYRLVIWFDN